MLKTGIKGKEEIIVNENHSAESLESGTLKVFGTPAMIALMEKTALIISFISEKINELLIYHVF